MNFRNMKKSEPLAKRLKNETVELSKRNTNDGVIYHVRVCNNDINGSLERYFLLYL